MSLSPQRLRVLLAVVRADGVVGAARALRLTPQAVSQQLGLLEQDLGIALFDRTRRRLVATELGRALAGHAERIEAELVAAERTAAASTERATGIVRLAAFQSVIRWLVLEALPLVRMRRPGVTTMIVELYGTGGAGVLTALRAGQVDVVIEDRDESLPPPPSSPSIRVRLLRREPYFIVGSPAVANALRSAATAQGAAFARSQLRKLARERWIASPEGTSCHAALRRLATRARFEPAVAHVCLEYPTVLALVRAGEGIAILPALAMGDAGAVEALPITGLGTRDLYIVQRTTARGTEPAVDAVVEALLAI